MPSSGDLVAVLRFFFGISDFYAGENGFLYGWYEWAKGTQQSALSLVANMGSKDLEHPNMDTSATRVVSSYTDSLVVGRADDLQLKTVKCLLLLLYSIRNALSLSLVSSFDWLLRT